MHFKFIENVELYNPVDSIIARIDLNIRTKKELFDELYHKLHLPNYFGFNWDALSECLEDFHWVDTKGICIVHLEIPRLPEDDLKVYFELLDEAVQEWHGNKDHYLEVIFPVSAQRELKSLTSL